MVLRIFWIKPVIDFPPVRNAVVVGVRVVWIGIVQVFSKVAQSVAVSILKGIKRIIRV